MSGPRSDGFGKHRSPVAYLLALGALVHLTLAASLGLSPDEAHYALYGDHPDWSYFDHPPLVGWLQAPFVAMGGADLLMRVVPMACWLFTVALSIRLCRALRFGLEPASSEHRSRDVWVVVLLLVSPLLDILGVALVPDTLLMPLVPATMLTVWRLRRPSVADNARSWWLLAGLLALCILAKYTGVLIVIGAFLSLLMMHGSRLVRFRGFWIVATATASAALPVLGWNAAHEWASLAYQSGHAMGRQRWQMPAVLRAVALQLIVFGILFPIGLTTSLRRIRCAEADSPMRSRRLARNVSLMFGVPILLVFAISAGGGSSLPHWTACGWTALLPLTVAGCIRLRRRAGRRLVAFQATLLVAILVLVEAGGAGGETGAQAESVGGLRLPGWRPNPAADVYGWQQAAERGVALAREHGARGLVVMNWALASRLAWYGRPLPVFVAPPRADQFQIWFGPLHRGDSAIVVDWSGMPLPLPVGRDGFERCTRLEQLATVERGRQLAHFSYLYCEGWRHGSG